MSDGIATQKDIREMETRITTTVTDRFDKLDDRLRASEIRHARNAGFISAVTSGFLFTIVNFIKNRGL